MITKFARLEFELFTKPSKSDFLRIHQVLGVKFYINYIICFNSELKLES